MRAKVEVHLAMPVEAAENFLEEVRALASDKYGVNYVHSSMVLIRNENQQAQDAKAAH
jgi:hypothetical protein